MDQILYYIFSTNYDIVATHLLWDIKLPEKFVKTYYN